MMRSLRSSILLTFLIIGSTGMASAELIADGRIGPAWLSKSRSHAVPHLFKPSLRLGLRHLFSERLELGGAVTAVLSSSEHYRVLGGMGHARFSVWRRPAFSLGAGAAVGLGYDADILHADLRASGTLAPYGFISVDGRWRLPGRWFFGVEAGWENLAVVQLGALVGRQF
jgi:hypothetical protein